MTLSDCPHPLAGRDRWRVPTTVAIGVAAGVAAGLTGGALLIVVVIALAGILVLIRPRSLVLPAAVTVVAAVLVGFVEPSWTRAAAGLVQGLVVAAAVVVPPLIARALQRRSALRDQTRALTDLQRQHHRASVDQALSRERTTMAAEIHDGLGHRLTLLAVRAARLSLRGDIDPALRTELEGIRSAAADASDELGSTLRLLRERFERPAGPDDAGVDGPLTRARAAGMSVDARLDAGVEESVGRHTRAALIRVLQEGLTNAAKHAPGAPVVVELSRVGEEAVLRVANRATAVEGRGSGTRTGLLGLRHRVDLLGGSLRVRLDDEVEIVARLPMDAHPEPIAPTPAVTVDDHTAIEHGRAVRAVVAVPVALLATAVVVGVVFTIVATLSSVLPADRFAALSIGQPRSTAEPLLPPLEMLDAPRATLPEPAGSQCRYYASSVGPADRVAAYRICFSDNRIVALDTVPPR